jgi:hypothetical protein
MTGPQTPDVVRDGGWPDAARPGVPLNPERDGVHWIMRIKDRPEVRRWYANWQGSREGWWEGHSADFDATGYIAKTATYLGPCLTPTEVRQVRTTALHEAAAACETLENAVHLMDSDEAEIWAGACYDCRSAILALEKGEAATPPSEPQPDRAGVFACRECDAIWRTEAQRDLCCTGGGA